MKNSLDEIENNENESWTKVTSAQNSFWSLNLKEILRYRDLLFLLVRRDFVALYKQTILGPIWFLIQPVFTALTYYFVLTRMGGIKTDGLPPLLFYISGITIWNYFKEVLTMTSSTFVTNAAMFGKVYFPRAIMPFSVTISQLIRFIIQMLLLFAFITYYHISENGYEFSLTLNFLILPIVVLVTALFSLSVGMIISAWTTKYRDLQLLVNFGLQLLMFFSAVVVPISQVDKLSGIAALLIEYNPIAQLVVGFKIAVLRDGEMNWSSLAYASVVMLVVFIWSIFVFNKTEKTFIDTV